MKQAVLAHSLIFCKEFQMDGTSLIPLESINAVEVFTGPNLDDLLAKIRQETATIVPDVLTAGGRKEIASLAYKVARSKTTIDDAGKELVGGWKKQSAVVDAARKKARDYLDALRDEVRKPLDDWEAEQARIEQEAAAKAEAERVAAAEAAAAELAKREAEIAAREAAIAAKEKEAADKLAAEQAERERAEREERIRAEAAAKAEREAAEAIERAEHEAAAAQEAARIAAEQAEADRLAAIERGKAMEAAAAERERVAAENAEKAQAEAVRQAEERACQQAARVEADRIAEMARVKAEDDKRAANKRHCASINNAVLADLVKAGCSEGTAKLLVIAIASGKVAYTSIAY
jgi:colicin import membrane protein